MLREKLMGLSNLIFPRDTTLKASLSAYVIVPTRSLKKYELSWKALLVKRYMYTR